MLFNFNTLVKMTYALTTVGDKAVNELLLGIRVIPKRYKDEKEIYFRTHFGVSDVAIMMLADLSLDQSLSSGSKLSITKAIDFITLNNNRHINRIAEQYCQTKMQEGKP
ncbi:hypothetical protein [Vibrio agarivorans]|uniref:Uncharacterized protein n=1 Tax=Vibrio agarivorans TaxID=153622 RepID=A0ABT7XYD3_9VIBR|nr:hypothetical protein [Vibrio agarivorans]MDN2480787.1 hypothetical protein [Vibrio agarivorans]